MTDWVRIADCPPPPALDVIVTDGLRIALARFWRFDPPESVGFSQEVMQPTHWTLLLDLPQEAA